MRWISRHGFAAAALLAAAGGAQAQTFADLKSALVDYSRADHSPTKTCADMGAYRGRDLVSIQAAAVTADADIPAYCRLSGTISPEVAFEVSLPTRWNGRFYMIGNGGLAGESLEDPGRIAQRNAALRHGFAFAQTNTGHDARKEPGGTFVLNNPQKAQDYAFRAVHVTAATARDLVKRYYSRAPGFSYWNACSNGGRQGLLEAQRYPEDFDGIYANAPWVDQTGFTLGAIWNQQVMGPAPIPPPKLQVLAGAVMARCDAIDGLADGLIDDPRRCDFDARVHAKACPAGADAPDCLTTAQAEAVMKVYRGPVSNGRQLFPGFMPGSEVVVSGGGFTPGTNSAWLNLIVPTAPGAKPADYNLAEGIIRFLAHKPPQPDYDPMKFDFDRDVPLLEAWGKQANATNPNLDRFRKRGGKLLITYGWADQVLQPLMGVHYYEQLQARYGTGTGDFARLFMVPGMTHCAGGIGTDSFDAITTLVNWVETGRAPDAIPASRIMGGTVVRTRPLCPYPQVARYSGTGSIDEAANFRCATP